MLELNKEFGVTRGVVVPVTEYFGTAAMFALAFGGTDAQLHAVMSAHGEHITRQLIQLNDELLNRHARTFTRDFLPELTSRQKEVIRLLACGFSTSQLTDSLQVSVNTVNKHVATIKRRLGARTTAQATALAVRWGLI